MTDPTVPLPPDPIMTWPVVTDTGFPAGLTCFHGPHHIGAGQPFTEHVACVYADGSADTHYACVYCPCDEPMEGAS